MAEMNPVTTPDVKIADFEIRERIFPELEFEYQVRDKWGDTPILGSFEEAWEHFLSEDGYRIHFPVGEDKEMFVWRETDRDGSTVILTTIS